nr:MAG TPA: hypothetical protein [Caudoviricetes sp.]
MDQFFAILENVEFFTPFIISSDIKGINIRLA